MKTYKYLGVIVILAMLLSFIPAGSASAATVTQYTDQTAFTGLPAVQQIVIPDVTSQNLHTFPSLLTGYSCNIGSDGISLAGGAIVIKESTVNLICIMTSDWNAGLSNTNPTPDGPTIIANGEDDYTVTISFADPVIGVGFRLLTNSTASETITLSFADGTPDQVFSDSSLDTASNKFEFVGFKSSHSITKVLINTTGGASQNEGIAGIWVVKNLPPTAEANGSYNGNVGESLDIDGTASDPNGDGLTTTWSVSNSNCTFGDIHALDTTLKCQMVGNYTLTLAVNDGSHNVTNTASITITDPLLTTNVNQCIASTYDRFTLKETKYVSSVGTTETNNPTVTSTVLQPAVKYLIEASGVYYAGGIGIYDIRADAKYTQDLVQRMAGGPWTDQLRGYVASGPTLLELFVDGAAVNWGGFNPLHRYSIEKMGTGSQVSFQFKINETYAQNNVGGLCVSVYEFDNGAPTADPGGPYLSGVNSAITFDASKSSDPDNDILTYAWSFGDESSDSVVSPTHNYSSAGIYDVCLTVNDGFVDSAPVCTKAFVNDPPTANPGGPYLGAVNTGIVFDGSGSSDPDSDALTYAWTFGDGTSGTGSAPTHSYAAAGIYDVCLAVNDGFGGVSAEVCTIAVVYDPTAGFVTGGGWINSPAGAYEADSTLSGKATFGFVAKYQKGANVPVGNTEFQFKAGNLNFKSTSYDWLVVAGSNAKFKGFGTINGEGTYKFMISADDGSPDAFRIQIWDAGDGLVYDNGSQQALVGGNIVVHN